jgi:Fe-S cluster biogenesis protein NfuA
METVPKYTADERRDLRERVERALERVRPALRADGGDCEIVDVTEAGRLVLRLVGTCGECPMSPQTMKQGIERVIHREVSEIREIVTE